MKTDDFSFVSATGVGEIRAKSFRPEGKAEKTVLVIHHGMAEHMGRYEAFIRFLTERGITVYMHDMASHGSSGTTPEEAGWFGEKDGWKGLVKDFRTMVLRAEKENPDSQLIVMGHSMGSFICRMYTALYPEDGFQGAIYMGTGGPNPAAGAGLAMASVIGGLKGKKHKSKMLAKTAFGTYGKRCEGRTEYDWLSRDQEIVDKYIADPWCGYPFTVRGMYDLIRLNRDSNSADWYRKVPKGLRILLISGEEDPVGSYGKGVRTVEQKLKETGHTHVTLLLYPECRHEVLNETNKQQVMEELLDWIKTEK